MTAIARGETPPGLRAPDPGDGAERRPAHSRSRACRRAGTSCSPGSRTTTSCATCRASAAPRSFTRRSSPVEDVAIADSFKVTGSVDIVGPGATGTEMVTATPTFTWLDDSSEDRYAITVFDSYGTVVWEGSTPKSVVTLRTAARR